MYEAGQRAFGENKVQDLLKKQKELADLPIQWHFIGRLQTNKINQLIDADVALIHSIDSLKLAKELDKRLNNRDTDSKKDIDNRISNAKKRLKV